MARHATKLRQSSGLAATYPAYLALQKTGELERRVQLALEQMKACVLCGRKCRVNRVVSLRGAACRTGRRAVVKGAGLHQRESDLLRGGAGAGTLVFGWCNLRCVHCEQPELSHRGEGDEVRAEQLARAMLELEKRGCDSILLVSASHVVAQVLEAVWLAAGLGLTRPLVYASGGYDSPEGLKLLDGVVDVYMPEMKYGSSREGHLYSHVRNYASVNRTALAEMHRQVGDLVVGDNGTARRGLVVRHRVLPGSVAGSARVLRFVAERVSRRTYVNLLTDYRAGHRACDHPPLNGPLADAELSKVRSLASKHGLRRLHELPDPGRPLPSEAVQPIATMH